MSALKAILAVFWLFLLPLILGLPFQKRKKPEQRRFFYCLLAGWGVMLGSFEILAVPMVLNMQPYSRLAWIYAIFILAAAAVALIFGFKSLPSVTFGRLKACARQPWTVWLAVGLILLQIALYVTGIFTDADDAFYVGTATTAQYTDQMYTVSPYTGKILNHLTPRYVLSPFPIFLAFISTVTQFHPTVVAHTIMPVFFVMLAYGIYSLVGERLFKGDRNQNGAFSTLLSVVHMFSYYSIYTQGTFMLIRIWQGKAFLAAVLLPGMLYLAMRYLGENGTASDWKAVFCLSLGACLATSMGIMLAPILLGLTGFAGGVLFGRWKKTLCLAVCCVPCLILAGVYLFVL